MLSKEKYFYQEIEEFKKNEQYKFLDLQIQISSGGESLFFCLPHYRISVKKALISLQFFLVGQQESAAHTIASTPVISDWGKCSKCLLL